MYDTRTSLFIVEPPKCMSRSVEEIVKVASDTVGKDVTLPGHLGEQWVIEHEHQMVLERGLPPIKGFVMVMREPVDRMKSMLSYTMTPRDGDIFANIDSRRKEHDALDRCFRPQTHYLRPVAGHVPKYFFTFDAIDRFAEFIGYDGDIPHNNPTPKSRRDPRDQELAEKVVEARYQDDVSLYKVVVANGGTLTIPAQGVMDY